MRPIVLLVAVLLASVPASQAAKPCNDCKDLPKLFKELMEQEFLRDQFNDYVKQSYYPPTVGQMYDSVTRRFNNTFYSSQSSGSGASGSEGGGQGGAAYGTRTWLKACDLVVFVKNDKGEQVYDDKKNPVVEPITPQQLRQKECGPIADQILAHEGHHQESCRQAFKAGNQDSWNDPGFVAKDEVEAYQKGIASLRSTISKLARDCGWEGSTNKKKPDGTNVVPTADQIESLKGNARKIAGALKKGKKR